MKTINLSVADETYMKLSANAAYAGDSINAYCEKILRLHLCPPTKHPVTLLKPEGTLAIKLDTEKDSEQYQPTDEEIEDALKSSPSS